jgi:glutathione synthase/RimK-type ligase-like ATP-grasp enzyme
MIEDTYVKDFCASEAYGVLRAVMDSTSSVVNEPRAEMRANSKLLQLKSAHIAGIRIPDTLVSNDPQTLRTFLSQQRKAIIKPIVCDYPHSIETRPCSNDEFADDAIASLCPTLVQELVHAAADIRVCMVGDQIFSAELRRADINERVDWRMTVNGWKEHRLPVEVGDRLLALKRTLELDTGSVDMRLTDEGDYVFLEINPSGQFLFLEVDAGLPVSAAYAEYLVNGATP